MDVCLVTAAGKQYKEKRGANSGFFSLLATAQIDCASVGKRRREKKGPNDAYK